MNTDQNKVPAKTAKGLIRKLAVSLILIGGLTAALPNSVSAGGKSGSSTFSLGTAVGTASVGWGGCSGCGQ